MVAVKHILDNLETTPSPTELEQMATYILYGKDENGKNAVQRGEMLDGNRRHAETYRRTSEKAESLDAILENPLADEESFKSIEERYIYTKPRQTIERPYTDKEGGYHPGDSDIPGMVELWDSIDRMSHALAVYDGKEPFQEGDMLIDSSYQAYQIRHWLVDLRRHQYYLKDAYKPTLHFQNLASTPTPTINFDSDSAYWVTEDEWRAKVAATPNVSQDIADYRQRIAADGTLEVQWVVQHNNFDWENPRHIKCLIDNYSAIYMQDWDKPDSWGRTLIYDFDFYSQKAHFSPLREYILTRRIDRADYPTIIQEIQEKFGVSYNESYLCSILTTEIPNAIARAAELHRIKLTFPKKQYKRCTKCGRSFPAHPLFFGVSRTRPDKLNIYCRACERTRRSNNGDEPHYDRRKKDPTMPAVQAGEEFGEF